MEKRNGDGEPPLPSSLGGNIIDRIPKKKRMALLSKMNSNMTEEEIKEAAAVAMTQTHSVKCRPQFWTQEEDEALLKAMDSFGNNKSAWTLIANYVPGRTAKQCVQRWEKVLQPGLKKGRWSVREDKMLIDLVNSYRKQGKQLIWSQICQKLKSRSSKQCRERWRNQLDPSLNKAKWTKEEDTELRKWNKKYPKQWAKIARLIPGRNENMVKYRWKRLSQFEDTKNKTKKILPTSASFSEETDINDTSNSSLSSRSKKKIKHSNKSKSDDSSKMNQSISKEISKGAKGSNPSIVSQFETNNLKTIPRISPKDDKQARAVHMARNIQQQVNPNLFLMQNQLLQMPLQALNSSSPLLQPQQIGQLQEQFLHAQLEQHKQILHQRILSDRISRQNSEQTQSEIHAIDLEIHKKVTLQKKLMERQKEFLNRLENVRTELVQVQKYIERLRQRKEKLLNKNDKEVKGNIQLPSIQAPGSPQQPTTQQPSILSSYLPLSPMGYEQPKQLNNISYSTSMGYEPSKPVMLNK